MSCVKYFSKNNDYNFDLISSESFFESKQMIQSKIDSLDDQCIVYMEGNKLLSVEVENNEKYWLLYEKAKFFLNLFKIKDRFVIISENDEFFYGYIDGFPCVFHAEFEKANHVMKEYAGFTNIVLLGVGVVEQPCQNIKTYDEIVQSQKIQKSSKDYYLNEDYIVYDEIKPDFDALVMAYLSKYYVLNFNVFFLKNCLMLAIALFFVA